LQLRNLKVSNKELEATISNMKKLEKEKEEEEFKNISKVLLKLFTLS